MFKMCHRQVMRWSILVGMLSILFVVSGCSGGSGGGMVAPEIDGNDVCVGNAFVYPPPGRIPIGIFELTFNPRTKEISAT